MSESRKVELVFQYTRESDGFYSGSAMVEEGTESMRLSLQTAMHQPEWVQFVVDTIKNHQGARSVSFILQKKDGETRHQLDSRTVEKIKDGSLPAEDLIL